MIRLGLAVGLAMALGFIVTATLTLDTDVRRLFGSADQLSDVLDTPEGRFAALAIAHPDRSLRSKLASDIGNELSTDPLVDRVITGSEAPPPELIDWLWRYRFVLAPPTPMDFNRENLTAELRRARSMLTSANEVALADRYLLDPTGSFRRLIAAISAPDRAGYSLHLGIRQSRDDSAALIFLLLADKPFDARVQQVFNDRLAERAARAGAEALLIGPRPISALISNQIAARSVLASMLACGLLLLWLLAILRPARNVLVCVMALGIGFLAAILAVQFIFGGVHVIALGFGGALMGMAMDYPIHLLAHRGRPGDSARARRYIGLCVATTGIAFLALIGSGVPALAQVGVLVACGLFVAAVASVILTSKTRTEARTFTLYGGRPIAVSWKLPALCLIALASSVVVSQVHNRSPEKLIEPPPEVIRSIERMGNLVDLPSGRFRVDVTGRTLGAVLDRQAQLATVLEAAVRDGSLIRASMLASYLPQRPAPFELPQSDLLAAGLSEALAEAGLAPNFATQILEAYTDSRNLAPPGSAALGSLMRLPELAGLMSVEGDVLRASVRLWGLSDPERLAGAVREIGDTGIVFVDQQSAIGSGLQKLTATAATWMAIGAGAGILLLLLTLRPMTVAVEIVLACLAAGLATAAAAGILTGGLGLFQIVALALVVGIGIDYGLFLTLSESGEEFAAATSSVLVCAGSTLIAFLTMALSEVNVLEDIGATLSIGVIMMLAVHFPRRRIAGRPRE